MTDKAFPHVLVYNVLTVSTPPTSGWPAETECWLREVAIRTRYPLDTLGEPMIHRHPVFAGVAGFASGRLELTGMRFKIEAVQLAVGRESHCLHMIHRAFAPSNAHKLHYSPSSWMPRFLSARATAWSIAMGVAMPDVVSKEIPLADVVSLGGLVGAPPLHLAVEALGLGQIARPLPDMAVRELLASREHDLICRQLLQQLWATAAVYVRMYFGTTYSVEQPPLPNDAPPATGANAGPELSPSP